MACYPGQPALRLEDQGDPLSGEEGGRRPVPVVILAIGRGDRAGEKRFMAPRSTGLPFYVSDMFGTGLHAL